MPRAVSNFSTSRQSRRAKTTPYTRASPPQVEQPDDINDLAAIFGPGTSLEYVGKQTLVVNDVFFSGSLTVTNLSGQDHRYVTAVDLFRTNGDAHDFLACLALEDHAISLLETAATEWALADAAPAPAGPTAQPCYFARLGAALYPVLLAISRRAKGKLPLLWKAIWEGLKRLGKLDRAGIEALCLRLKDGRELELLAREQARIAWPHVRETLVNPVAAPYVAMCEKVLLDQWGVDIQARLAGDLAAWVARKVAERANGVPV